MDESKLLFLNGVAVEVKEDPSIHYPSGSWLRTVVYIYDGLDDIGEKEIQSIMEYLYNEGFIMDRRTAMKVIKKDDTE
ncbi:hypothetical protein CMI37_28500 [Candidatus Pacearchaeota archaeon]|nr:hypothetical protein [Candidatus Pacearchaeota archaeon]